MKKKRTGRNIRTVLLVLFLAVALLVFAGTSIANYYLNQIPRTYDSDISVIPPEEEFFDADTSQGEVSSSVAPPESPPAEASSSSDLPSAPAQPVNIDDDHLINILLVGQDRLEGQGRQRSDSMILCSINTKTKEVALISFLRDLYVQIPGGYSDNRLNATYAFGGFPLLNETLTQNFGISIDANIEVDFYGFEAIIDRLGGVDLTFTAKEAAYLNNQTQNLWDSWAVEGENHVSGLQALYYARIRKIDSDFGRTQRQRNVLNAVYASIKDQSLGELLSLMESILPYVTTDMTNGEIVSMVTQLFPLFSSVDIQSYSIPGAGTYTSANKRGMSVLVPDLEANRRLLRDEYLPLS